MKTQVRSRKTIRNHMIALLWGVGLALSTGSLLSGCTNGLKSKLSSFQSVTPTAGSGTSDSSSFKITQVLLDSQDPSGTFDILGDGSNAIGNQCTAASGDSSGKTDCVCVFNYNYTDPNTSVTTPLQIEADTTYHEANLLRCNYSALPATVTDISVSILVKSTQVQSNQISFQFTNGGNILDTTKIYSFQQIYRFTCRKKIYIPDALDPDSGVYDPIQSESPDNSYPVSFYTSNVGASLMAFAGSTGQIITDYECPSDPLHSQDPNFEEPIYSLGPDSGSSYIISGDPTQTPFDMNAKNSRSTFLLAKARTGVFTVPVDAYIAPELMSDDQQVPNPQGGGLPTLGWGAAPRSTGSGTERCPDEVSIPTGYHWVKVWLFRMALPVRQYLYGANLQALGDIGCNPGPWPTPVDTSKPSTDPVNTEVPDCGSSSGTPANYMNGSTTQNPVARFSNGIGICFDTTFQGYSSNAPDPSNPDLNGTSDWLQPRGQDQNYSCGMPKQSPVATSLNICGGNHDPYDGSPIVRNLDDPSALNYEFLFVVSPEDVMTYQMSDSSSSQYMMYTPERFRVGGDCSSSNPGTCSTQYLFRNYALKLHSIKDGGDPPTSTGASSAVFPVCAIQPD